MSQEVTVKEKCNSSLFPNVSEPSVVKTPTRPKSEKIILTKMSQEVIDTEKHNLSSVSNVSEASTSSNVVKTPTRTKSEILKTVAMRKPILKKSTPNINKKEIRKRSLTMSDIRSKTPDNRTPIKQMKKDSCSTADHSPRSPKLHPAEKMLAIRCRELQVRTFAKMFYNLWKKQRNLAQNYKEGLTQLELQKSFLITLRENESKRREEITKVADKQKNEINELMDLLSLAAKEQQNLVNECKNLQGLNGDTMNFIGKSCSDFDMFYDENQRVIVKIKEINDLMDSRFLALKRTLRWAEDVQYKTQDHLATLNSVKEERNAAVKTIEHLTKSKEDLQYKLKIKEENEKNLKETIKELRRSLENSIIKNEDLKSEVKNMTLKLEFSEHQIAELKIQPCTWSDLAKKAAKVSMVLLLKAGLLPTF